MGICEDHKITIEVALPSGTEQLTFLQPPGTFALTPASNTLIQAIIRNSSLLTGIGIDWGSGVGCLAIVASKIANTQKIYGLEISEADVAISIENSRINEVPDKAKFILSDSYTPINVEDKRELDNLNGNVDFIISNPPSSKGDDGFGFRREVLRGAKIFLKQHGKVFLNISLQYGQERINRLPEEMGGFEYKGVLYSTDLVPFDLGRKDLLHCLELYCQEERSGGYEYGFINPDKPDNGYINACSAFEYYKITGKSPLTRWQTHLFEKI